MMEIKVKDFLKLCGEKQELVELCECDTMETEIIPVAYLFDIVKLPHTDLYNVKKEYADIMEADIASWDYDGEIICIYYFL